MTTFPAITDETGDLAPAGGFRGPSRLTPVTVAKWLMAQGVTTRAGENDLDSHVADFLQRRGAVEAYDSLPDASLFQDGDLIFVNEHLYVKTTTRTADVFTGVSADLSSISGAWRGTGNSDAYALFGGAGGSFTANPNNAISYLVAQAGNPIEVGINNALLTQGLGREIQAGDVLEAVVTIDGDATTNGLFFHSTYVGASTGTVYMRFGGDSDESESGILTAPAGSSWSMVINNRADGQPLFTHGAGVEHWILYDLVAKEQVPPNYHYLALHDLEALPEDLSPYIDSRIISVHGETFKKVSTNGETEDIFEGTVGPSFQVGHVVWRGASNRFAQQGLANIGLLSSNPDNIVSFIGTNNLNQIRLCILKSAYETVKGSVVAAGDTLGIAIAYPENSAADTVTLTYQHTYAAVRGGDYLVFQASGGANYDMYNVPDDQRFQLQILDASDGTSFFEHESDLPHWLAWEFEAERSNQAALNGIENEIGTLDDTLDRVQADIGAFHRTISPDWQRRAGNAGEIGAYGLTLHNVKAGQVYDVEALVNIPDMPAGTYDTQFYFGVFFDSGNTGRTIPFSGDDFHGDRQHSGDLGYIWEDANGRFLAKPASTTGLRPSDMAGYIKSTDDNTTIKTAPAQWEAKKDNDSVTIWLYAWSRLTGTSENAIHDGSGVFRAAHGFSVAHPNAAALPVAPDEGSRDGKIPIYIGDELRWQPKRPRELIGTLAGGAHMQTNNWQLHQPPGGINYVWTRNVSGDNADSDWLEFGETYFIRHRAVLIEVERNGNVVSSIEVPLCLALDASNDARRYLAGVWQHGATNTWRMWMDGFHLASGRFGFYLRCAGPDATSTIKVYIVS